MQIAYSTHHLSEIEWSKVLFKIIFLSYLFEQTAISSELKQEVDFISIMEKAIHF